MKKVMLSVKVEDEELKGVLEKTKPFVPVWTLTISEIVRKDSGLRVVRAVESTGIQEVLVMVCDQCGRIKIGINCVENNGVEQAVAEIPVEVAEQVVEVLKSVVTEAKIARNRN